MPLLLPIAMLRKLVEPSRQVAVTPGWVVITLRHPPDPAGYPEGRAQPVSVVVTAERRGVLAVVDPLQPELELRREGAEQLDFTEAELAHYREEARLIVLALAEFLMQHPAPGVQ